MNTFFVAAILSMAAVWYLTNEQMYGGECGAFAAISTNPKHKIYKPTAEPSPAYLQNPEHKTQPINTNYHPLDATQLENHRWHNPSNYIYP